VPQKANPAMNTVKTFDYFCHNTMVTVSVTTLNPWWMLLICGVKSLTS